MNPPDSHIFGITNLGSGSSGNATVIHGPEGAILLDAGFSAKELTTRLESAMIDPLVIKAVMVSHEHSDHTKGVKVFAKKFNIPVFASSITAAALARKSLIGSDVVLMTSGTPFDLAGIRVEPFSIPHDAPDTLGFLFLCRGRRIAVATDIGSINNLARQKLGGANILLLEANHDKRMLLESARPLHLKRRILSRFGHLSNDDAMLELENLLTERTTHLLLGHISSECNNRDFLLSLAKERLANLHRCDILLYILEQNSAAPTFWAV